MDDLDRLIERLKARHPEGPGGFERGYQAFRLGAMLQLAREDAGMTQEQVAQRLGTKKSAISRIENHAGDLRLSTLQRYAEAVGRELILELGQPGEARAAARRKRPGRKAAPTAAAVEGAAPAKRTRRTRAAVNAG
jgi:transcriptional regulator with XRE-family HTH domain